MKHNIKYRLLSAAAAAALSCSLCTNTVQALADEFAPQAVDYTDCELVDVIVKLSGNAVLAAPEASGQGADYIETDAAQSAEDRLRARQDKAEEHIRRFYPELKIKHRFTLTANGFSCSLPESLISEIESYPLVESVVKVKTDIAAEPQLATATELGGITDYCNNTDCTGEGEVIAVIDTEFYTSHDMFAPLEGKEVKLDSESIAEICSKGGFSSAVSADKAYLSSKVPFAYDYSDSTPYTLDARDHYHGTHVSGIAAGNRITAPNGSEISGVAPDAQLLMMKVYGGDGGIFTVTDEAVAAAIEDAVKLKADVINMSFGRVYEYYDRLFYADSIEAAANAGITLCASSGNVSNDRFGYGNRLTPENVDTGNISEPSIFPQVFSVASADNTVSNTNSLKAGELELEYCECGSTYCCEVLSDKEYPLTFIDEDKLPYITSETVGGKIAVYSGSSENYLYLDKMCLNYGAAGIIIADDSCIGKYESYLYTTSFPVAVITREDCAALRESAAETVTFSSESVPDRFNQVISAYSSYGVGTSLDLKPEIMGIGGNVLSADCNNKLSRMSGTSMASPYIAGCAALYDQLMKKQNVNLFGKKRSQRLKSVLMNSAVPYSDDGIPMSPRRQGAGLVALDKAINDKVIMTGASGKAAIELHDGLGYEFGFELNITNISSEDVTFTGSNITLTTDGSKYDVSMKKKVISGQTLLYADNDLDTEITVPAGETVTKTVNVKLPPEQLASIGSVFTSGFFVEGYISLYNAENCCDISIPLLGFCGDWCKVPTIDKDRYPLLTKVSMGYNEMRTDISFTKTAAMLRDIVSNDIYLLNLNPENPAGFPESYEYSFTAEQKEQFRQLCDGVTYFSPNNDVFGDYVGCYYVPSREASFTGIDLYDSNGKLLYATDVDDRNSFETKLALPSADAYSLPDGRYSGRIDSYIRYGDGKNKKQSYSVELAIDTTPPEVEYEEVFEGSRKYLRLKANDTSLDGIYIFGSKIGPVTEESRAAFNALGLTQRTLSNCSLLETDERIFTNYPAISTSEELTDFQTVLTGMIKPNNCKFCDIIPAEPDENGDFVLDYDITGMLEYSVTVVDRALNEYSFHSESSGNPTGFTAGVWKGVGESYDSFYEFSDDGRVIMASTDDKSRWGAGYTIEGNTLIYEQANERPIHAKIRWSGPYNAFVEWEDGRNETLIYKFNSTTLDEFNFFSDIELGELARRYYASLHGFTPEYVRTSFSSEDTTISLYVYDYKESNPYTYDVYTVDRETAIGVNITGDPVDLNEVARPDKKGVWSAYTTTVDYGMPRYFNFTEFNGDKGKGVYAYQSDGIEHEFECEFQDKMMVFSFDSYEDTGKASKSAIISPISANEIALIWDNGFYEKLKYHYNPNEISDIGFMTNETLIELARKHFRRTTGRMPAKLKVTYNGEENTALIIIFEKDATEGEQWTETYTVDVITGKGTNADGIKINLLDSYQYAYELGDVNGDGKIDAKDSSEILVYYSELSTGKEGALSRDQQQAADVNADSRIDAKDASAILGYYAYVSTGGTESLRDHLSPSPKG